MFKTNTYYSRKIKEYRTLEGDSAKELDKLVRIWLDYGFEPYGFPDRQTFDCGVSKYRQTVVKYEGARELEEQEI